MGFIRRLVKTSKVVNKQMLLQNRREPYKPQMGERRQVQDLTRLGNFERKCAEGIVFVPDDALPPWKRSIVKNLTQQQRTMNFRGLRVRAVDRQDEPGFPTFFR